MTEPTQPNIERIREDYGDDLVDLVDYAAEEKAEAVNKKADNAINMVKNQFWGAVNRAMEQRGYDGFTIDTSQAFINYRTNNETAKNKYAFALSVGNVSEMVSVYMSFLRDTGSRIGRVTTPQERLKEIRSLLPKHRPGTRIGDDLRAEMEQISNRMVGNF